MRRLLWTVPWLLLSACGTGSPGRGADGLGHGPTPGKTEAQECVAKRVRGAGASGEGLDMPQAVSAFAGATADCHATAGDAKAAARAMDAAGLRVSFPGGGV